MNKCFFFDYCWKTEAINIDFYRSFNFKVEVCINDLIPMFEDLLVECSLQFNIEYRRGKIFEKVHYLKLFWESLKVGIALKFFLNEPYFPILPNSFLVWSISWKLKFLIRVEQISENFSAFSRMFKFKFPNVQLCNALLVQTCDAEQISP